MGVAAVTKPNNFVVFVGGARCGSTWLFEAMKESDLKYFSETEKEEGFFLNLSTEERNQISGYIEFSTDYLYDNAVMMELAQINAKIIIGIRNPVTQFESQEKLLKSYGLSHNELASKAKWLQRPYRTIDRLKYVLANFDCENVFVYSFERFSQNPISLCQSVANFLHIDTDFLQNKVSAKVIHARGELRNRIIGRLASKSNLLLKNYGMSGIAHFLKNNIYVHHFLFKNKKHKFSENMNLNYDEAIFARSHFKHTHL